MSASLVGSEMCIRDSRSKTLETARALADLGADGVCGREGEDVFSAEPVSYTHLTLPTICSV
eukprot:144718-Alexandrium_andersonii.AAC.1